MIVLNILNGAGQGNQMFMYSMAYALARKTNQKILINVETTYERSKERPYILDKFHIDKENIFFVIRMDKIKSKFLYKMIRVMFKIVCRLLPRHYRLMEADGETRCYKEIPLHYKNYILNGCFECFAYFDAYHEDLSRQFVLNYDFDSETKQLYQEIAMNNSVAFHVRVGDFVKEGRTFNLDYYISMMKKLNSKFENCVFYVACQDESSVEQLKQYGTIHFIHTTGLYKDLNDWNALRICRHHVLTNSTYSWWAAYLSEGQDVYIPEREIYLNAQNSKDADTYYNFYKWK